MDKIPVNRGGRPTADLTLMAIHEIARREGISVPSVYRALHSATQKIRQAGAYEGFVLLVKVAQTALPEDFHPIIRCGSIECRPEKWVLLS